MEHAGENERVREGEREGEVMPDPSTPAESMKGEQGKDSQRELTPQPMDMGEIATALRRKLVMVDDVDEKDKEKPSFCVDYVKDIYTYLRQLEVISS